MAVVIDNMLRLSLLFLVTSVCPVFCFPSKPLNERSAEISWQAWLLVDDQNKNDAQPGMMRRRITPKSVFVAPTFTPESLPACAEGYRSDVMGRCIKIIKLDDGQHLNFLLDKLNEQFGDVDYEDDYQDEKTTAGPVQFNIPLDNSDLNSEDDQEESGGIAIVVAPTNGSFNNINSFIPLHSFNISSNNVINVQTIIGVNQNIETTTTTTTDQSDTTTDQPETTTGQPTEETTLVEGSALFFLTPTEMTDYPYQNEMLGDESVATSTGTSATNIVTDIASETTLNVEETTPMSTTQSSTNFVRFPHQLQPTNQQFSNIIKFPEDNHQIQHTRDTSRQSYDDGSERGGSGSSGSASGSGGSSSNQGVRFEGLSSSESHNTDSVRHQVSRTEHGFNHRNREKHSDLFFLPPEGSNSYSSQQKPIVLRFSRKHGYIDMQNFKNAEFYRQVPSEDLSYIFGFKTRHSNHR